MHYIWWLQQSKALTEKTNEQSWDYKTSDLVRNQTAPLRSHRNGLPWKVRRFWILFDKLPFRHSILCRKLESFKTSWLSFHQALPPALVHDLLHFLKCSSWSNQNFRLRTLPLFWPGHKRCVEVLLARCFVFQKRNNTSRKSIHSVRVCKQFSVLNGRLWFLRPNSAFCRTPTRPYDLWSLYQMARSSWATRSLSSSDSWNPRAWVTNLLWVPRETSIRQKT